MHERLVELLGEADDKCRKTKHCVGCVSYGKGVNCVLHNAADHLLANCVITPPCKVGQTVYCIRYDKARKPFVKPLVVLSVTICGKGRFTVFTTKEDTLGKTVFLTKEEAEEALAKKGGAE